MLVLAETSTNCSCLSAFYPPTQCAGNTPRASLSVCAPACVYVHVYVYVYVHVYVLCMCMCMCMCM